MKSARLPPVFRAAAEKAALGCGTALLLAACLFGSVPAVTASRWLVPVTQEVLATFRDPGTQWMVLVCCGVYFATFTLLQQRKSRARFWRWGNPDVWLTAALVWAAARYAFGYGEAGSQTDALVLLGGVVIGKGIAWLLMGRPGAGGQKLEKWAARSNSENKKLGSPSGQSPVLIAVLLFLLVVAVLWQSEAARQFQYREQTRWSGPWDNPNVFGMLMAVGVVLAIGRTLSLVACPDSRSVVSGFRVEVPGSCLESVAGGHRAGVGCWTKLAFFLIAAGILGFGLVKSYSRGAWVGAAVGLGYLGWRWLSYGEHRTSNIEHRTSKSGDSGGQKPDAGGRKSEEVGRSDTGNWKPAILTRSCVSCFSWCRRNWAPVTVIVLSLLVLAFWSFQHTEQAVVRRAFSAGNLNDFSWRNRVAAWVGSLQMMAERPLAGYGWNQPERMYDQYYRAPSVHEGMAIQLNDYLTLGTTLGIPALVCFLAYMALSLSSKSGVQSSASKALAPATCHLSAATVCRAGALVLLLAFWFDGGLFRLATATVFWVLLELGRER